MAANGPINSTTLTRLIQRFLKCQDHPEMDRLQAQDHLIKLLIARRSLEERTSKSAGDIMNYLASLGPRKVCQYQFKTNDIVWICKECQKDETCVICNECYQASNHEGHDVYFYHSVVGGCCDCGDADAWSSKGFCTTHGQHTHDPVTYIPKDICQVSAVIFDEIAEALLKYASYKASLYDLEAPRRDRADDLSTVVMMYDEFHTVDEFSALLGISEDHSTAATFQATGSTLLHTGNFEECRSMAEAMQMKGFNVYVGYVSDKAQENRMVAAITFLHQLAVRSDGMCRLICNTLDEDILTRILTYLLQLSKELGRIIYDLLMILMADQSFKVVIAVAYTQAYAKIARLYGRGLGLASQSVYSLSVQFLNRELFVNEICFGHNFLKINVAAVTSLLDHAQLMSQSEPTSVQGNQLSVTMTKALKHSIVLKRRYNPIIGDLKVIFTNRRVARYFLSTSLPECLNLLESFQYVHPQKRALDVHVEYEDQDWMAAFNLNLGISSLFDFLFTWFADPDASCVLEATYNGFESYPESFTTLKCTEDGWMADTEAASPDAKAASSGRGMRSLMRSLSGRVTQYFNPTAVAAIPAHLNKSGTVVPNTTETAGASKSPVHKLSSAWKVLHTIAERCFAWERRFRETNGTGITLPPREKTGNAYAQYGESFGEDVQLIDLIQDFALRGVGKLPRLLSFHIPLHRILAHAIFEACKHQHLTACLRSLQGFLAEKASSNAVPLNGTIDIPLFCIVMSTQINLHMWQRNGQCMADQALNYGDFPFCRIYKELDTLLIQFLLTVHPTDQFVSQLFYRFGVAEYVAHRKAEAIGVSANSDASYLPALLDEALKYIVNLVTELPTPSVAHAAAAKEAGEKADSATPSPSTAGTEEARSAKHAWSQNQLNESAGRLLPLVRRELLHKLIGGAATYSQLQECFGIYPEASKLDSDLIDAIITELTVKHDNILQGAPTYTLRKELWAEYDPCFPRVPGSVHQKAFEDRPKITATAPIITKPFVPHECFATVRNHMLLAPVLLRVQRDLLYVAAAERCSKKAVYKSVREKWTLKCNDSIYGKVIQLLTLSIYVTKDLKAAEAAAQSALYDHASGAATALEKFMLEEIFLPDSESAFNAYLNAVNGTRLPSLLHVLMDIYYANDPLDVNSKHWVQWLIEQTSQLSTECAQSAQKYRVDNGIITASSAGASGGAGAAPAGAKAGGDSKALSAKEKAMQAMQAKAAQFMMMMEGMSDDSDDEDADDAPKPSKAPAAIAETSMEASSTDASGTVTPQKDGKAGAEVTLADHSVTPVPEGKDSGQAQSGVSEEDAVPVCIICQADANAENAEGNMRMLGYLALVQASTLLSHPEGCLDCTTQMRIAENVPSISSKVAPKKLSTECNAQISFCGHGMHNDCFEKYLPSQLRKSTEQSDMVLDQTKLQFCCPLCKKLGNLFMPYVETDPVQIEVREGVKAKLATALKKKQATASEAEGALTPVPPAEAVMAASISPLAAALLTTAPAAPVAPAAPAPTPFAAVWPDIVVMPKATTPLFPVGSAASAMDCDTAPAAASQPSWTSWINHPSLMNCDSSVFTRARSASVTAVTFDRTISGHERGSALKRARSQTNDSADFGRISTKPNTGVALLVDVGVVPDATGEESPLRGARMDEVVDDDPRDSGSEGDQGRDSNEWQAEYMGYSLNDIDLNSTSTDRNASAAAALEADLQGISIDTVGSLDERESETYEFLMDFAFNQQEQQDALSELEKAKRKQVKMLETLRHHSTENMLHSYLKRKAWAAYLEDYVCAVYTDFSIRGTMQLETKINQPPMASYGVIVPFLEAMLRSVAYSTSCDLAEHNIPGYHLLTEGDLSVLSGTAGVSGEKAGATSAPEGAAVQSAASVDLNTAPWMYIKKYSRGMDEYRYLEKTVDAVACVLHCFDSLDIINHSVMLMLTGISSRVSPHSPGKSGPTVAAAAKIPSWLPMPSEMSFSNRAAPIIHTTPLLAAPLLDTLVLCIALAKAAPAGSVPSAPILSPRGTRHAPRGPPYHPQWNIDHCCRWICLAKLVQLLVLEVEQTSASDAAGADTFAAWPSVASFASALWEKVSTECSKHSTVKSVGDAGTLGTERAKTVMYQWVAFMRTVAHVLYRTNKELFGKTTASTRPAVSTPAEWLQRDTSGASLLVQSIADVTDQQVRKHLTLMAMSEIISVEGSAGPLNGDQTEILGVAGRWVSDLLHATETKMNTACEVDVGVSTSVEVADFLKNDSDAAAGVASTSAVVTKLPAVDAPATTGVKQHWSALQNATLYCYPRISRPALISLPKEYTKLHAMVLSKVSAHRTSNPTGAVSADGKAAYENPALCLVCATVVDAAGRGQCAAHAMKCGGESSLYFLLQECQVLLCHGPRSIYFNSPYVDVYGESQHQFRGKPLLLDARRYEALNHLWSTHQIPREVVSKRSTATRIVINNYY